MRHSSGCKWYCLGKTVVVYSMPPIPLVTTWTLAGRADIKIWAQDITALYAVLFQGVWHSGSAYALHPEGPCVSKVLICIRSRVQTPQRPFCRIFIYM